MQLVRSTNNQHDARGYSQKRDKKTTSWKSCTIYFKSDGQSDGRWRSVRFLYEIASRGLMHHFGFLVQPIGTNPSLGVDPQ
jgi:hypothetical protein